MTKEQQTLIVGSGLSIRRLAALDTREWTVVALNKAWRYCPRKVDYVVHSQALPGSFRPDDDNAPKHAIPADQVISYKQYHPIVRCFARHLTSRHGIVLADPALDLTAHLIHFNASYWVMAQLRPQRIAYLGCDFDYRNRQHSHYYGKGQAILAEERGRRPLSDFFAYQSQVCQDLNIALFNLSASDYTQLPYPRLSAAPWLVNSSAATRAASC